MFRRLFALEAMMLDQTGGPNSAVAYNALVFL
jgi:hypothetical protein